MTKRSSTEPAKLFIARNATSSSGKDARARDRRPQAFPPEKASRTGPSVFLVLACALVSGIGLALATAPGGSSSAFASIGINLPESWRGLSIGVPEVLTPLRLGEWPSWLIGRNEETRSKSQSDTRPAIAIVIDDLGVDQPHSRQAMALPPAVTLSFLPYPDASRALSHEAHLSGHQIMVHLSMQPVGAQNPGPNALTAKLPAAELKRRVEWALDRVSDFEGANNHMGSRFTASRASLRPVMQVLNAHGMFFVDSRTTASTQAEDVARENGLLTGSRDVFLDDDESAAAVERQLELTEEKARTNGTAIAIGHPHPETLAALKEWTTKLEARGFRLVPVNEVLQARANRPRSSKSEPVLSSLVH